MSQPSLTQAFGLAHVGLCRSERREVLVIVSLLQGRIEGLSILNVNEGKQLCVEIESVDKSVVHSLPSLNKLSFSGRSIDLLIGFSICLRGKFCRAMSMGMSISAFCIYIERIQRTEDSLTRGSNPVRSTRKTCEFFRIKNVVSTLCRCAQTACVCARIND